MQTGRDFDQEFVDLIEHMDPVLKKLRESYVSARISSVASALFVGPFSEIKMLFDWLKGKKFELLPMFVIEGCFWEIE